MKNVTLLLFLGLLSFTINNTFAQDVIEKKASMSLGAQSSFYVEIPGADKKIAEASMSEMLKEYGKLKENRKAKESFLMATKIQKINGTSPIDLYVRQDEGKNMMTTYIWIDLGGAFANSEEHKSQSDAIRQFMADYFITARKKVVENELKEEEKNLNKLNKDLSRLEDRNKGFHDDIAKAKKKIEEAENNIVKNIVEQEDKTKEIESQKEVVKKVTEKLNSIGKRD